MNTATKSKNCTVNAHGAQVSCAWRMSGAHDGAWAHELLCVTRLSNPSIALF